MPALCECDHHGSERRHAIGLKYVEDMKHRIPRAEVSAIERICQQAGEFVGSSLLPVLFIVATHLHRPGFAVQSLWPNEDLGCCACGSYRRGAPNSGDVDIILAAPNGLEPPAVLQLVLAEVRKTGLLTDDLNISETWAKHDRDKRRTLPLTRHGIPSDVVSLATWHIRNRYIFWDVQASHIRVPPPHRHQGLYEGELRNGSGLFYRIRAFQSQYATLGEEA